MFIVLTLWESVIVLCFVVRCFYVHSSIAITLIGKRELIALLNLYSWCHVMVEWLFFAVPWGCLRFVLVVIPDHTHLLFLLDVHYIPNVKALGLVVSDEKVFIMFSLQYYVKHVTTATGQFLAPGAGII